MYLKKVNILCTLRFKAICKHMNMYNYVKYVCVSLQLFNFYQGLVCFVPYQSPLFSGCWEAWFVFLGT